MVKKLYRQPCKHRNQYFRPIVLSFWLMIFVNLKSFGEGIMFCFDEYNRDSRLDIQTKLIDVVHTRSKLDCIRTCAEHQRIKCESVNYNKTTTGDEENCELVERVDPEEHGNNLKINKNFDHLIILAIKGEPGQTEPFICQRRTTTSPKKTDETKAQTRSISMINQYKNSKAVTQATNQTIQSTEESALKKTESSTTEPATKTVTTVERESSTTQATTPTTKAVLKTQATTPTTTSAPKTTEGPTTQPTIQHLSASSCKELLKKNSSLPSGAYTLENKDTNETYKVYCYMDKLPGCGDGRGWTLVMKVNGTKNTLGYNSSYWSNKTTYQVEYGLEGLTEERETKLASYCNTPFTKICLGMKKFGGINWIAIDHNASSLFDVIANGTFTQTNITKSTWKSLITGSKLYSNCYKKEGFNVRVGKRGKMYARIGIVGYGWSGCDSCCMSCFGFGTSITSNLCPGKMGSSACGNIYTYGPDSCSSGSMVVTTFGYILVQ